MFKLYYDNIDFSVRTHSVYYILWWSPNNVAKKQIIPISYTGDVIDVTKIMFPCPNGHNYI